MAFKTQAIESRLTKSPLIKQRLNQTHHAWSLKNFEDIFAINWRIREYLADAEASETRQASIVIAVFTSGVIF